MSAGEVSRSVVAYSPGACMIGTVLGSLSNAASLPAYFYRKQNMPKRKKPERAIAAVQRKRPRPSAVVSEQIASELKQDFVPQTPFGQRLWEIRRKILAGDRPLLGWKGIEKELFERRGERSGKA